MLNQSLSFSEHERSRVFVVVLHFWAFAFKGEGEATRAIFCVAPFNLAASGLIIGAAFIDR